MSSPMIPLTSHPFPVFKESSQESQQPTQPATGNNPFGLAENPPTQPKYEEAVEDSTTTPTLHREGAFHAGLIPREDQ